MSVIRPRPPTDPVDHVVHSRGLSAEDGPALAGYRAWVARAEACRAAVVAMPVAGVATGLLAAYGTLGSPAPRRESVLFALLDRARRVREAVDLVVVVGDRADRAVVDLLLATCCHPFHDLLPRHERGGRPRILSLGPGDDDDRIQGVIDVAGITCGDSVADAWLPLAAGACVDGASRGIVTLLGEAWRRPRRGAAALPDGGRVGGDDALAGRGAPWSALLAAAIAGVDVVRLLEGAAAMERRFAEAAGDTNPVLTAAALGACLRAAGAGEGPPRRRLLAPAAWHGLVAWHDVLCGRHDGPIGGGGFVTPIVVRECRRAPFGAARPAAVPPAFEADLAPDRIDLPRADEHTIGQLLALLLLEREVTRRLG